MNNIIYLDNAATTFPKPASVVNEVRSCIKRYCGNPGRASHALSSESSRRVYECRERLDRFFNVGKPENIVFTLNTTYALNIVLSSVLRDGDHVITSNAEHNSVLRPLSELEARGRIRVTYIDAFSPEDNIIQQIKNAVCGRTRAVVMTHCSNICPLLLPIERIGRLCESYRLKFIVDAAQSAGVYDIDMKRDGIYALCIPSHKSLYGIQGAGAICFSERCNVGKLQVVFSGGNGIDSKQMSMPSLLPERLEAGTLSVPAIVSLSEGIKFVSSVGTEKLRVKECALSQILTEGLRQTKKVTVYGSSLSPCVLFNVHGKDCEYVAEYLASLGICVRSGFHCAPLAHKRLGTYESGAVRASFGAFNTESDALSLISAIKRI